MDSKEEEYELISQADYGRRTGMSRPLVNYHVKKGNLKTGLISGVPHIKVLKNDTPSAPPPKSK